MRLVLALSLALSLAPAPGPGRSPDPPGPNGPPAVAPAPGPGPEWSSPGTASPVTALAPTGARQQEPTRQRWLVRLQLARQPVLAALMDGRPHPLAVWSTTSYAEVLVRVGDDLFLVDTRQGRLFQMADAVRDQLERDFQLLFAYPVPRVEEPRERPADPVEIVDAEVEARAGLVPAETPMGRALNPSDTRVPLMPNVAVAQYREAWRVSFRVDDRRVVLFLEPPTDGESR